MQSFNVADTAVIIAAIVAYIAFTSWLTVKLRSKTSAEFLVGGRTVPAIVVGILLMSEFIGAKSTVGVAQAAFESGVAAAWAVLSAAIAFPLFGFFLAKKLYSSGEYTISGVIAQRFGRSTELVVSLIIIYALLMVNVGNYVSGAASLAATPSGWTVARRSTSATMKQPSIKAQATSPEVGECPRLATLARWSRS